jgi:hypothetical protein
MQVHFARYIWGHYKIVMAGLDPAISGQRQMRGSGPAHDVFLHRHSGERL